MGHRRKEKQNMARRKNKNKEILENVGRATISHKGRDHWRQKPVTVREKQVKITRHSSHITDNDKGKE